MTKEWTSYAQLNSLSNLSFEGDVVQGMSDEEELLRWAGNSEGYGETLVDVPDENEFEQDLRDLGLIDNE